MNKTISVFQIREFRVKIITRSNREFGPDDPPKITHDQMVGLTYDIVKTLLVDHYGDRLVSLEITTNDGNGVLYEGPFYQKIDLDIYKNLSFVI